MHLLTTGAEVTIETGCQSGHNYTNTESSEGAGVE